MVTALILQYFVTKRDGEFKIKHRSTKKVLFGLICKNERKSFGN